MTRRGGENSKMNRFRRYASVFFVFLSNNATIKLQTLYFQQNFCDFKTEFKSFLYNKVLYRSF